MTAAQIIDEIKRLSPAEQAAAVRMVYQLDAERKLSGPELSPLAEQFVNSQDAVEAARVREMIVRGFYGVKSDAWNSTARSACSSASSREISANQLSELATWLDIEPQVSTGK